MYVFASVLFGTQLPSSGCVTSLTVYAPVALSRTQLTNSIRPRRSVFINSALNAAVSRSANKSSALMGSTSVDMSNFMLILSTISGMRYNGGSVRDTRHGANARIRCTNTTQAFNE